LKNILFVDDIKETTDLVKKMLRPYSYNLSVTNSGKECMELLRKNKYDLILLDLAMPGFSGVDIMRTMKEDGIPLRIVLFSASPNYTDIEIESLKKEYGVLDRMRKPFTKQELLSTIEKNLA
jgi:CheY-like chemotaxis protein